ncbi:MAG: ATP-binding protein [Acidimicrobiales bacterium]
MPGELEDAMRTEDAAVTKGINRYVPIAIEARPADVDLVDPDPHAARSEVRELLSRTPLGARERDDLVGAVSEVVTNAHSHGSGSVHLQGWADREEVVVTVSDEGTGPQGSDLGGRPVVRAPGEGGLGLWLARQLCDDLALGRMPDGFIVRLRTRYR